MYNPKARYLEIRKNFGSISSVIIVPYKNSKKCERIQWPLLVGEWLILLNRVWLIFLALKIGNL